VFCDGQSVQLLCCVLDIHYSDVRVAWTVSISNVLWVGQSVQQLCCGLSSHDSDVAVGWTVRTATAFCFGIQDSERVLSWTVIIMMLPWSLLSVQDSVEGWFFQYRN